MTILDDATFDREVLQSDLPVLVDFWAENCAPCRMLSPVIEQLAGEYSGRVKVAKLNVDDCGRTMSRYGIRGIPTLLIFRNGEVLEQMSGAQPKDKIVKALNKYI